MKRGRRREGGRLRLFFNGQRVGFATTITGSEQIDYEPVETIDFLQVRPRTLRERADDCIRDILAMTCRELQRTGRL